MSTAMSSVCLHVFWIILFVSLQLQLFKYKVQGVGEFPQLLTNSHRHRYFSIKTGYRLTNSRVGKREERKVIDEISCVYMCMEMEDKCTAVNIARTPVDGHYLCEIMKNGRMKENQRFIADDAFNCYSLEDPNYQNCAEIYKNNGKISGVYRVKASPSRTFPVYCDMVTSGGGWTVIQKRQDGSVDFYRVWDDYKKGFGNKLGEYWLGLDTIHKMTSQGSYRLRVDMEDFWGVTRFAEYDSFYVADEADNYRLSFGAFKGNTNNAMAPHNRMPFSTIDRDNDPDTGKSCANYFKGGWWYNTCFYCNLNGLYGDITMRDKRPDMEYMVWYTSVASDTLVLMKRVVMKIRPMDF